MGIHRRDVLSAIGVLFPAALTGRGLASDATRDTPPVLRFRTFEEALRVAFADARRPGSGGLKVARGIEIGHSDLLAWGVQGCHNERPFAGYPAGHLRIVRAGSEPGPLVGGVRLYVCTVDVALAAGQEWGAESRPLDFAVLPPAPVLDKFLPDSACGLVPPPPRDPFRAPRT